MAEQFYSILTSIGKAKIANASVFGTKLNLTTLALGDGNGKYYNPMESQEALVNEVWRGNVGAIATDSENSNWIVIETMIAGNVGGFFIREVGVLDDEGSLIAIGKYPETYKPIVSDGATKDLIIRMILEVDNASSVTLKIDPTTVIATKKDIEMLDNKIKNIKIPVTKVNNKLGDVTLKAEDIKANNDKTIEENIEEVTSQMADMTTNQGDLNTLKTTDKTSVVNALNELFTNANNLKSDWAGVIGSPLLETDTSAQLKSKTQTLKNTFASNLTAKGQSSNGNETLNNLINKVSNINTGKKWATGVKTVEKTNVVSGLSFTPNIIIITFFTDVDWAMQLPDAGLYVRENLFGDGKRVYKTNFVIKNGSSSVTSELWNEAFTVTSNGFSFKYFYENVQMNIRWIAFE